MNERPMTVRDNIVAKILNNHIYILLLLDDMIGWRAGYEKSKVFTEQVLSKDLSSEVYLKSNGLKIDSGFITGEGLYLGKLINSWVYARQIDPILGEDYYEKMTPQRFIQQLDKLAGNLRYATMI